MSSDDRLERLGLAHLANDPEKLAAALQAIVEQNQREADAFYKKRDADKLAIAAQRAAAVEQELAAIALPAEDLSASVAKAYEQLGGGARDRSAPPARDPKKPSTTRSAPLVSAEQFGDRMDAIGGAQAVLAAAAKLEKLPASMRILALESLYGAADAAEVASILAQLG